MEKFIYDFTVTNNKGQDVPMAQFRDNVLLIVNTASRCGFTPQYKGLEALYEKYKDRGLVILGFPCDQFMHQEPGSDEEIASFCEINFGVTFPLMKKINVNGPDAIPLYKFLKRKTGGFFGSRIKWNFTKFLVSRDGQKIKRFAPVKTPEAIEKDIVAML